MVVSDVGNVAHNVWRGHHKGIFELLLQMIKSKTPFSPYQGIKIENDVSRGAIC